MQIAFPYDLRKDLHPYLDLSEWTLREEVGRWHDSDEPEKERLGAEWRQILERRLKWRMAHEVVLDLLEAKPGERLMGEATVEGQARKMLPRELRQLPFK